MSSPTGASYHTYTSMYVVQPKSNVSLSDPTIFQNLIIFFLRKRFQKFHNYESVALESDFMTSAAVNVFFLWVGRIVSLRALSKYV